MANPLTNNPARVLMISMVALALLTGAAFPSPVSKEPLPTPEQLVARIQAGRAAFHTFDVSSQATIRTDANGQWEFNDTSISTHSLHWLSTAADVRVTDQWTNAHGDALKTQNYSAPEESIQLQEGTNLASPQAVMQRESLLDSVPGNLNRIWNELGPDYLATKVTDANSKVRRLSSGYLLLRSNLPKGAVGMVTIDDKHGYLPIRWEMRSNRGDLVMWASATDVRKAGEGLWLPSQYAYGNAQAKTDCMMTKVTVNGAIADIEMKLDFPGGTHVNDRIGGTQYVVKPALATTQPAAPEALETPNAPATPAAPAKRSPAAIPQPGDIAPDFAFKTVDGADMKLSDFKGKVVLLDFWATTCGPCVGTVPHLKEVQGAYGTNPQFKMISLSVDKTAEAPRNFAQAHGVNWAQGFLGDWKQDKVTKLYGVHFIPSIWLIGTDGKVMTNNLGFNEITTALAQALSAAAAPASWANSERAASTNVHIPLGKAARDFAFQTMQGGSMRLSDFRGKYVLLQFWATQSGESMREMPNIKAVYDAYVADPRLKVVSIFDDFEEDSYRHFLPMFSQAWNMNWFQGHCMSVLANGYFAIAGTYVIPQICLIGPDGKILAKDLHGESIKTAVAQALAANAAPAASTPGSGL